MRFRPGAIPLLVWLTVTPAARAQAPDPYKPAVEQLQALVEREVADKRLPALSIALVDDQRVVWSKGFGHQDRDGKVPATAETVYRVGSVSKLFTDVAVMRLVEQGEIDLDAPVTKYLPDFKPVNPFDDTPITLRHLMAHRSGLIREPPVGNYFDPTGPTLAQTVASVNGTDLVYPPGKRVKYSNAAIGVVGYALEKTRGEKFETYLKRQVLDPLGMTSSSFEPTPATKKGLADAVMWTYHGREFPAPTFELGMAPAGSMYSTVLDLAKFASCLFAGGGKPLLKPETVAEMFRPQFAKPDAKDGFGIGFMIGELEGKKKIGHGGAIYGFATELAALPEEKLGVVVVASRDVANDVVERIAEEALRLMLAAKHGKPLPAFETPKPLPRGRGTATRRPVEKQGPVVRPDRVGRPAVASARTAASFRAELRALGERPRRGRRDRRRPEDRDREATSSSSADNVYDEGAGPTARRPRPRRSGTD